ncbi:MAG: hypothetical protein Q7T55_04870 [Solirubrobacteraceae bacterium]|nr:hypothetical protein [Solirubrobacteraceae bacterium]
MNHLDPTAVVAKAFGVYRDHVAVLFPIALGVLALQSVVVAVLAGDPVGTAVSVVQSLILATLLTGIFVEVARDVEDGVLDSSTGQLISAVVPAIMPLIIVGFLAGIAVTAGLVLVVPGLFLATIFAVVAPVTVLERPGVLAAFGRSRDLVRGNGWQVFGLVLFNILLSLVVSNIVVRADDGLVGSLISWVVASLVAPLSALVTAIAYLQLRALKGEAPLPTGVATADGPLARPGTETF